MEIDINTETPIDKNIVAKNVELVGKKFIRAGNTRMIRRMVDLIEAETDEKYIRMEVGEPGIRPLEIELSPELAEMKKNVSSYPPPDGLPVLKTEMSKFLKSFLDIDIPPLCCIPTVGSLNGCYASFMTSTKRIKGQDTILFIDPGFPAHKSMARMLGFNQETFDAYEYRGEKLRAILYYKLSKGNIAALLYSNPNNPAWICFTEEELKIIAELADEFNVIAIEDLAYFGMDFRKDFAHPGAPPYPPTIANYTDNCMVLISSSKAFSYAGERIAILALPLSLYNGQFPNLLEHYSTDTFGMALVYGSILLTTGGVSQSVQLQLTGILRAANEGRYIFLDETKVYGEKAEIMKQMFIRNGFSIVYDRDGPDPIADGFFFTVSYPGFEGDELSERLLYYGISSIPLSSTGSLRAEGIRICVSIIQKEQFPLLEQRLMDFQKDNV
ncbi:MAG: Aminotransferase [Ignavibacteria bacterium]|nr:Aminotransferase [Ignavibacteria bacterium]